MSKKEAVARGSVSAITPWRLRALTIPPHSLIDWLRLAAWELWMGSLVCALLWSGGAMIATAPDRIITAEDLSGCYASPPVVRPCERIVYRTGAMNAAFSVLSGMVHDRRRIVVVVGALGRGGAQADHGRFPAAAQRLLRPQLARSADVAVVARNVGVWVCGDWRCPLRINRSCPLVGPRRLDAGEIAGDQRRNVAGLQIAPIAIGAISTMYP